MCVRCHRKKNGLFEEKPNPVGETSWLFQVAPNRHGGSEIDVFCTRKIPRIAVSEVNLPLRAQESVLDFLDVCMRTRTWRRGYAFPDSAGLVPMVRNLTWRGLDKFIGVIIQPLPMSDTGSDLEPFLPKPFFLLYYVCGPEAARSYKEMRRKKLISLGPGRT